MERERFRAALYNTRIDESPESLGQLLRRLHLLVGYERPTTPGEPPTLVIRVRIVGGTVLEHFTEKPTPATPLARPKRTRGRASKQGIARTLRDIRAFVRVRLLNEGASAPRTTILLLVVCGFGPRLFPTSRTMTASDFIRRATLRFDKLIRNRRQKKP